MDKEQRFGFLLTRGEKHAIVRLAELEGGLSQAALIRRLIRDAAKKNGIQIDELENLITTPREVKSR